MPLGAGLCDHDTPTVLQTAFDALCHQLLPQVRLWGAEQDPCQQSALKTLKCCVMAACSYGPQLAWYQRSATTSLYAPLHFTLWSTRLTGLTCVALSDTLAADFTSYSGSSRSSIRYSLGSRSLYDMLCDTLQHVTISHAM